MVEIMFSHASHKLLLCGIYVRGNFQPCKSWLVLCGMYGRGWLTYIRPQRCNATLLEATLALDSHNKVTAKYSFASEHGHVKYTYLHDHGTALEPSYDFQSQSWHFGVGHKFGKHDHATAVYDGHNKNLGLEWTQESKEYGHFKV